MTSPRDRFRLSGNRDTRLRSSRGRRQCRPAVERLENYRLLASVPISQIPTITQIISPQMNLIAGNEADFEVVVSPAQGDGTPTGFIQLSGVGELVADPVIMPLQTLPGGQVGGEIDLTLAAGANSVSASYLGDANYAPSNAQLTVQAGGDPHDHHALRRQQPRDRRPDGHVHRDGHAHERIFRAIWRRHLLDRRRGGNCRRCR